MLIFLQKIFVRPERYNIGFRLGFYFQLLQNSQVTLLFDLFKKGTLTISFFDLFYFCDFSSKEFFTLLNLYRVSFFQTSDRLTSRQQGRGGLSVFCRRVPRLKFADSFLPPVMSCVSSNSAALSVDFFSTFAAQVKGDFQIKYCWSSVFCFLLKTQNVIQLLTKLNYLRFFVLINLLDGAFFNSYRGRFLVVLQSFLSIFFHFFYSFIFILKYRFYHDYFSAISKIRTKKSFA